MMDTLVAASTVLTSPLRGEVAAKRRVRGSDWRICRDGEPLTPTLSPQGRGSRRPAPVAWEQFL